MITVGPRHNELMLDDEFAREKRACARLFLRRRSREGDELPHAVQKLVFTHETLVIDKVATEEFGGILEP